MMGLRQVAFLVTIHLLVLHNWRSQTASAADPFGDFDNYANAALKDWNTPGMAVVVVKDQQLVFAGGYGVRKLGQIDAVDVDTVFPIASITKSFNATAMAMLVDDGKVGWMDRVAKHLPEFQLHDDWLTREIRIADLLAHRSGLKDPDRLCCSGVLDRKDLIFRAQFLPQVAPFRTGFHYNNLGTVIAGEIIERVTGHSWDQLLQERILQPLEMHSSVGNVVDLQARQNVATSYVTVNGELQEDKSWNLPLTEGWLRYRETIRPAGAICSTANDMAKFAIFHLNHGEFRGSRLLKPETVRDMQALHSSMPLAESPVADLPVARIAYGAGFGWLIRDYQGRKLVMHDGSTGCVIGLVPEEHFGVVVLTNLGSGIQFMVMHDIIDRLLGIPRASQDRKFLNHVVNDYQQQAASENRRLELERINQPPRFALARYAGSYESEVDGRLVIEEAGGGLSMRLGPNCQSKLSHWSKERFRATFVLRFAEDWFVDFDSEGDQITRVTISSIFPYEELAKFERVSE